MFRRHNGFTLVELLVAMFLTSLIGVLAYALFATTSDNVAEVDSLEATSSRARYAVERLRRIFQSAGAGSTPDSNRDPFVQPRLPGGFNSLPFRITGFYPYQNWQDDVTIYPGGVAAANPNVSLDGVIIAGSFDFPAGFEASGFENGTENIMNISGHYRGMDRLAVPDPFHDVDPANPTQPDLNTTRDWSLAGSYDFFGQNFTTRLLRISDAQGYLQFVGINRAFVAGDVVAGVPWASVNIELEPRDATLLTLGPRFKESGRLQSGTFPSVNQSETGLDIATTNEGDRAYSASFVDFFWLHVVQAPGDPNNLHLVMERLCPKDLVLDAQTNIAALTPGAYRADSGACPGGVAERYLIADRVADFQVWFDCADTAVTVNGVSGFDVTSNTNWTRNWLTPDHTAGDATCMQPVSGTWNPGRARVAHFRITLRTENERKNLKHFQFEDPSSATGVCNNPLACDGASLRTFDAFPNLDGASAVVTVQADVKLYNYEIKDL